MINQESADFIEIAKAEKMLPLTGEHHFALDGTTIHVWQIPLDKNIALQEVLRSHLSSDELQRADRYIFDIHRARFVIARGALRRILGSYLGQDPDQIRFQYNRYGKPSLVRSLASLRFNVTHSGDLALCAVARDRELGIDIEAMRPILDADRMATRYFDPLENSTYQQLAESERPEGFLVRWTMKEAYIKARGEGLSLPLDQFSVLPHPDERGFHRIRSAGRPDGEPWCVRPLITPSGYIAAIVAQHDDWSVRYQQWYAELPKP